MKADWLDGTEPGRDGVLALVDHGAFADGLIARAGDVFALPPAMPFDIAAGFPIAYGTAHGALVWRAALQAGEVVLVEPNPERLIEVARFRALDGKTWNPPAFAAPILLVRNDLEAAAYELPVLR